MIKGRLLLVEDDSSFSAIVSLELKRLGHEVTSAKSGSEALKRIAKDEFDVVLTDLKLGDLSGLDVLAAARKLSPQPEVIVLTGHGSVDSAVAAMKAGAFDFLTKPINGDELALTVSKALEHRGLVGEVRRLREELGSKFSFEGIVYASPAMRGVLDLVKKVAATDASVLIEGESGTGKELVARAIHENSTRRNGSFVAINCGALPEGLLESELFGHVRGAFTGAERNKRGLFEEASGGTIFLDEIGEMSTPLQVKLLRALQEGEVRRVGDNHPVKISARVLAATNKELGVEAAQGRFREDLYYRLKVFPIRIPPLRERPEDILPLAEHFLRKAGAKMNLKKTRLSPDAASALKNYAWPGNARELEHAMERSLIMAEGKDVSLKDLPPELLSGAPPPTTKKPAKRKARR